MFLDGSLGSRTAWMLEPYEGSRDRGMPITGESEARDAMRLAATNGIAATVHAIGDAAVRRALDLMSGLPRVAIPHRIEHFQCVHPLDLDRAARRASSLSMQPAHLLTDIPLVDRHWGSSRPRGLRVPVPASPRDRGSCSAATCRWPRSTRARACSPRWSAGASDERACRRLAPRGEARLRRTWSAATPSAAAHAAGVRARRGSAGPGLRRGPRGVGRGSRRRSGATAMPSARAARCSPWSAGESSCGGDGGN